MDCELGWGYNIFASLFFEVLLLLALFWINYGEDMVKRHRIWPLSKQFEHLKKLI
jgi:hypothetical protein